MKRTLGSCYSMNRTGNKVVLDGENSYLINKSTRKKIKIHLEGRQYVFYMWIKAGFSDNREMAIGSVNKNRYAVLAADGDADFKRQEGLVRRTP